MKRLIILPLLLSLAMMVRGQSECRYWFDEDLGTMKSGIVNFGSSHLDADVSNLINGIHVIYYVIKGYDGVTSIKGKAFIKTELGGYTDCTLRYWFDEDSLVTTSPLRAAENVHHLLDVSHLQVGAVHSVKMVAMKEKALLSSPVTQLFYIPNDPRFNSVNAQLFYWLDENSDSISKGTLVDNGTFFFDIDVSALENGEHTISFFLADGQYTSEIKQATFIKVEATGIHLIQPDSEAAQQVAYDLKGYRIDNPKRNGLYIVNGKKAYMK